ncbi:unnamed protein product, partial [Owenia fusiformis]
DSLDDDSSDIENSENCYEVPKTFVGLVKRITPGSRRQSAIPELHKPKERRYAKTLWPNIEKVLEQPNSNAVRAKLDSAATTLNRSVEYDMEQRGALMNSIRSGVKLKEVKSSAPLRINKESLINVEDEFDGCMEDIDTPFFENGINHQSSMEESQTDFRDLSQEPDLDFNYKTMPIKPKHQSTPLPEIPKIVPHYSVSSKGIEKQYTNGDLMMPRSMTGNSSSIASFPADMSDAPLLPTDNHMTNIQVEPDCHSDGTEPNCHSDGTEQDIYFKSCEEHKQKGDENANDPIKLDIPDKREPTAEAEDEDDNHIYSPVANQSSTGTNSYGHGDPGEPQGLYSEVDDKDKHNQDEDNIYEAYEPVSYTESEVKSEVHIKSPLLDVSNTNSFPDDEDLEKPLLPPRNLKPMSPNISKRKLPPPPPSPDRRPDTQDANSIKPPALPKRTYSTQNSKNSHSSPPDTPAPDRPKWATIELPKETSLRQRLFNRSMPNFKRPLRQESSDGYIEPVDTTRPRSMTDLQTMYSNQVAMSRLKDYNKRKTKPVDNFFETATFAASERLKSNERKAKKNKTLSKERDNHMEIGFKLHYRIITQFEKLLQDDPEKFALSLGRAVRTNNIAAVKVLCSILRKENFKYSVFGEQKKYKLTDAIFSEYESGATLLHLALMYNHTDICDHLIAFGGRDLIMATYTSEKYFNQTTLHIAVSNKNSVAIRALLKPLDIKDKIDLMNTNATGSFYRNDHIDGQTCLTAALWAGSPDIVSFLVKEGANLMNINMQGENILHRMIHQSIMFPERDNTETLNILQGLSGLFGCRRIAQDTTFEGPIYEHAKRKIFLNLLGTRNADGYTPLLLAAKMKSKLMKELLNLEDIYKMRQINLGSSALITYDVTEVSTRKDGNYNKFSCLHIVAHDPSPSDTNGQLQQDINDIEPLSTVFQLKWNVYKWVLIVWFLLHLSFMVCLTHFSMQPLLPRVFQTENNLTIIANSAINVNGHKNVTPSPQYETIIKRDVGDLLNHTLTTNHTLNEQYNTSTGESFNTTQVSAESSSTTINTTTSNTTTTSTPTSTTKQPIIIPLPPSTKNSTTMKTASTTPLPSTHLNAEQYLTKEPTSSVNSVKVPDNTSGANDQVQSKNQRSSVYALFISLPCIYMIMEMLDILCTFSLSLPDQTFRSFVMYLPKAIWKDWSVTGNGPYRLLAVLFSTCVLIWFALYMSDRYYHDIPLAGALLFGWVFILHFGRACPVLGKFPLMIQTIFFKDIVSFMILYMFIWLAFSFAIHSLIVQSSKTLSDPVSSTLYSMIQYVITDLGVKQSDHAIRDVYFGRVLLTIYGLVSILLLIHMLIAIMSTSHQILKSDSCALVKRQQLSLMLMIERRLIWCKPLCDYSERSIYKHEKRYYIEVRELS